jgi:hypothetical protein
LIREAQKSAKPFSIKSTMIWEDFIAQKVCAADGMQL